MKPAALKTEIASPPVPAWLAAIDAALADLAAAREGLKPFLPPPGAVGPDYPPDPNTAEWKADRAASSAYNTYLRSIRVALDGDTEFLAEQRAADLVTAKEAVASVRARRAAALRDGAADADIDKLDGMLAAAKRAEERLSSLPLVPDNPERVERMRVLWERFWNDYVQRQTEFRATIAKALRDQAALQIMLSDASDIFGSRVGAVAVAPFDVVDAYRAADFGARADAGLATFNERAA
ncbi:MAG: hypothetical protein ACT4O2_12685 [Beijerinckiaceae bacterium]